MKSIGLYEPLFSSMTSIRFYRLFMTVFGALAVKAGLEVDKKMDNLYYASHQGAILMLAYFAVGLLQSVAPLRILTHFYTALFQLTLSVQFLIFVFYWPLLSYPDVERIMANPDKSEMMKEYFVCLYQHIFCPVSVWFAVFLVRTEFKAFNIVFVVIFAAVFTLVNWQRTIDTGVPVYEVVDWKGPASHAHLAAGISLAFLGFYVSLKASRVISRKIGFDKASNGKTKEQ